MRIASILFCLFLSIVVLTGYAISDDDINADYYYSRGVHYDKNQNFPEAFKWYLKSAELGHAGAQNSVGVLYIKGLGVTQDHEVALRWLQQSADQGFADAQVNLAYLYHTGNGVAQDSSKAEALLLSAAKQGTHHAMIALASVHDERGNYVTALAWALVAREKSRNDDEYYLSRDTINNVTGGGRVMKLDEDQYDQAEALANSLLKTVQ